MMQVWDRDLWIRTETAPSAYEDKFRPAEQLYGACIEPRSNVDFVLRRNRQAASAKQKEDAAAKHAAKNERKKIESIIQWQGTYLGRPEPPEELEENQVLSGEARGQEDKVTGSQHTPDDASSQTESQTMQEDVFASFATGKVRKQARDRAKHSDVDVESLDSMHGDHAQMSVSMPTEDQSLPWEELDSSPEAEDARFARKRP
jgi:hypothetical protein